MSTFDVMNQIVSLTYDVFEKYPDRFVRLDDDTVSIMIDISSKLDLQDKINRKLLEILIKREYNENLKLYDYSLNVLAGGSIYFKYKVAELDAKTAIRFFEADHMLEKQEKDFELVRDTLLTIKGVE